MPDTLPVMGKKSIQVRIPDELARDAAHCAAENGESLPEYVTRAVRQLVARDMPRVAKTISKRVSQASPKEGAE